MKFWSLVLSALVGFMDVSLVPVVAETYEIDWTVPADGQPLPTMNVLLYDIVIFNYGTDQPHDVWIHPNKVCETPVDRIRVKGNTGPGVYNFTETGQHFFVCSTGGHCELGLNVRIFAYENECELQKAAGLIDNCDELTTGDGTTGSGSGSGADGGSDSDADGGSGGSGNGDAGGSGGLRATIGISAGAIIAGLAALLTTH